MEKVMNLRKTDSKKRNIGSVYRGINEYKKG